MRFWISTAGILLLMGTAGALAQDDWMEGRDQLPKCAEDSPPVQWSDCRVSDKNRRGADYSGSVLTGVTIDESQFDTASFAGARVTDSWIDESLFNNTNFSNADLRGSRISGSVFNGSNFQNADLQGAELSRSRFEYVDFRNASLRNATLRRVRLTGANLSGAIWTDGRRCAEGSIGECR